MKEVLLRIKKFIWKWFMILGIDPIGNLLITLRVKRSENFYFNI